MKIVVTYQGNRERSLENLLEESAQSYQGLLLTNDFFKGEWSLEFKFKNKGQVNNFQEDAKRISSKFNPPHKLTFTEVLDIEI